MHGRKRNARDAKISHKFELSEPKRFENRKLYIHATNPHITIVGIDLFGLFSWSFFCMYFPILAYLIHLSIIYVSHALPMLIRWRPENAPNWASLSTRAEVVGSLAVWPNFLTILPPEVFAIWDGVSVKSGGWSPVEIVRTSFAQWSGVSLNAHVPWEKVSSMSNPGKCTFKPCHSAVKSVLPLKWG